GPVQSAVLVDGEDALSSSQSPVEGLVDGVAQDALREPSIEPRKARGRGVVDGQDEAEVDRAAQAPSVVTKGPADGRLGSTKCSVLAPDPEELPPPAVGQPFLAVRDVADLARGALGTPVIAGFHEEHFSLPPQVRRRSAAPPGGAPPPQQLA